MRSLRNRSLLHSIILSSLGALALAAFISGAQADEPKLKAGFIYVGPISDAGWTHAQEEGRLAVQKACPWVETSYVESVSDGDLESYIDQMVSQGNKVIFVTSTSFMDGTIACAPRYPDVMFFCASCYKRLPNVATYQADPYQTAYLQGIAAGALSKSGKIGSVSSYPTPDVVRLLDAFTIGLREVNPKAQVTLRWLNTWYDPPAAKEAAETLLSQGCDVLISDLDSPTVAQVGEEHGVPANAHGFYAYKDAPKSLMAAGVYNWGPSYVDLFNKIHDGTYTPKNLQNVDLWWRLAEKAIVSAYSPGVPLNPRYKDAMSAVMLDDGKGGKISAYDLYFKRLAQMSATPVQFEPFTGPITDSDGNMKVPAGQTASQAQLFSLTWRVPGIIGNWPL
jgi:simple sugar transport system substrate-binding protein